jgi:hypothetical protein
MNQRVKVLAACLLLSWVGPRSAVGSEGPSGTPATEERPGASEADRRAVDPGPDRDLSLAEDPRPWIPMRIRDMTLPNGIAMGFVPTPAAPLGKGHWAIELQWARANNFIATENVERFLQERGLERAPLTDKQIAALIALPGDAFLLDGEFSLTQLAVHYGISRRSHLTLIATYLTYLGGDLDGAIAGFHDTFSFSNAGAEYLPEGLFQAVFDIEGNDSPPLVLRERPTAGGFGDPQIIYHYAFPQIGKGWRLAAEVGFKPAVAKEEVFLSTGNEDFGVQFSAECGWLKHGIVLNGSYVFVGDYVQGLNPANLWGINATLMRYLGKRWVLDLQGYTGDSLSRNATDTGFGELEVQFSLGFKFYWKRRFIGFGLTENFANFDNTPDIGFHFTVGGFVN